MPGASAGRRGSRTAMTPARPDPPIVSSSLVPPSPAIAVAAVPARRALRASEWMGTVIGLLVGCLIGLLLGDLQRGGEASGAGVGALVILAGVVVFAVRVFHRRRARCRPPMAAAVVAPRTEEEPRPARCTDLDRGVREIRETDRGFDPARFAGYAAMVFRDVQSATTMRDPSALRDRLTPDMYRELHALCDGLGTTRRSHRFEQVEICPEVTEAWQDGDRDYVTAYIAGSMLDYTVDEATGVLVGGSRRTAIPIEKFLTFTRPAGLNFWMLSLIQSA